jgi:hypothetical protein
MPMPGHEPVHRLHQAVDNGQTAQASHEPQAREGLRDPEHRLAAGHPPTVRLYDVQSGRECAGLDPRGEVRELARDPLGGHETQPLIAVEVPQALDGGEAYPAFAVVADG